MSYTQREERTYRRPRLSFARKFPIAQWCEQNKALIKARLTTREGVKAALEEAGIDTEGLSISSLGGILHSLGIKTRRSPGEKEAEALAVAADHALSPLIRMIAVLARAWEIRFRVAEDSGTVIYKQMGDNGWTCVLPDGSEAPFSGDVDDETDEL